jgi:DNA-binding transcriptional LysR family regulator
MPLTLTNLRILLSAGRHGSFSRAAEELNVTQPYVSGQIASLESHLGTSLFRRVGRRVYLTDAGRVLLSSAEHILETVRQAEQAVEEIRGLTKGSVTVAATSTPGRHLVPELIARFLEIHPGVAVSLAVGNNSFVEKKVIQGKADIGIVASEPADAVKFEVHPLAGDEIVMVVSPQHKWARRTEVSFSDVAEERLIWRERGSGTRKRIEQEFQQAGVSPAHVLEVSGIDALKSMVAAGLGASFISRNAVDEELSNGLLVAVPIREKRLRRTWCLLILANGTLAPTAAAMKEFLLANAAIDNIPQH